MLEILKKIFPFEPIEIKKLDGYENENYLVKTTSDSYVFKTYFYTEEAFDQVEAENSALLFLQKNENRINTPRPISFADGSFVKIIDIKGRKSICRILSFLEGELLNKVMHTKEMYQSFGVFLAEMNLILQGFDNKIIQSREWEWGLDHFHLNKNYIQDITDEENRNTVKHFFQEYEKNVLPVYSDLRKSIIHNDANDWNVLVDNGFITGIIDFGDMAYSPLINELAVAIAYGCYTKENPIEWASIILKSYHSVFPIEEKELTILYYLIAARLCVSVCNSSHFGKENPENEYIAVSQKPAWDMLNRLLKISPIDVENEFRKVLGFSLIEG